MTWQLRACRSNSIHSMCAAAQTIQQLLLLAQAGVSYSILSVVVLALDMARSRERPSLHRGACCVV